VRQTKVQVSPRQTGWCSSGDPAEELTKPVTGANILRLLKQSLSLILVLHNILFRRCGNYAASSEAPSHRGAPGGVR
jgi:hypothetical protein